MSGYRPSPKHPSLPRQILRGLAASVFPRKASSAPEVTCTFLSRASIWHSPISIWHIQFIDWYPLSVKCFLLKQPLVRLNSRWIGISILVRNRLSTIYNTLTLTQSRGKGIKLGNFEDKWIVFWWLASPAPPEAIAQGKVVMWWWNF